MMDGVVSLFGSVPFGRLGEPLNNWMLSGLLHNGLLENLLPQRLMSKD